jgi:hypothetical protein
MRQRPTAGVAEIPRCENGDDPGSSARGRCVYAENTGMRMVRADEGGVQDAGNPQVVEIVALSSD